MLKFATSLLPVSAGVILLVIPGLYHWWSSRKARIESLPEDAVQMYLAGIRSVYWGHRFEAIKACTKNPFLASRPEIVTAISRCAVMDPDGDVQRVARRFMNRRKPLQEDGNE